MTIDELLSSEQALSIAQEESRQKRQQLLDLIFGLLDCSGALFLFLPLFGQYTGGTIHGVSLLALTCAETYLKAVFLIIVVGMFLLGLLTLALQTCQFAFWNSYKATASILWNTLGTLLFIVSRQPYAAIILFAFLAIKSIMLAKK